MIFEVCINDFGTQVVRRIDIEGDTIEKSEEVP
jgi:hypothetical protein